MKVPLSLYSSSANTKSTRPRTKDLKRSDSRNFSSPGRRCKQHCRSDDRHASVQPQPAPLLAPLSGGSLLEVAPSPGSRMSVSERAGEWRAPKLGRSVCTQQTIGAVVR